ncbi:NADH-quinone oxidoreductase subunit N [Runella slithyformis]|uniref:NADH-quinone oxidoreductase subunit N n=1 Tax=Runella slithyformis (strain ATCC 29530 / DSM 19594 / LMG 11500 / NCIMB 11436 / LSU 4) TaxID=761193 RepID=A0A7U4E5W4_RUNSL|nr:NADH-quinone oxidoreductase subunit N [Runella slithyformis]AEI48729.1 NAD(P)H-quinone oxidoreductase subunit 2 [Runella slithyformis DSM 19594]
MLPIVLLSILGLVVLFLGFQKSKNLLLPATLFILAIVLVANFLHWNDVPSLYFKNMLFENKLTMAFSGIVILSAFLIVALTRGFVDDESAQPAEYYTLMLFSLVGAVMMIGFENLIMLFVGVEILSVSMYILTGSDKKNLRSNEAALKYFLMGAFATGIMLFGMALLYGATGSFNLTAIKVYVLTSSAPSSMLYVGLLMLLIGMLFKVSAAPFHFWTPDVYDGAPTIFTTYMSTIVKTAGFAAIYRLLSGSFSGIYSFWWLTLAAITVLTLLAGNVTAVYQQSFKRMMAYSSVSHAGYLLLSLTALTNQSQSAIVFYSLAYSVATISAFGVLMVVAKETGVRSFEGAENFEAFNGLGKKNPLLAFVLTVSMLSLAGIPLTAGFWGKFFVFSNAADRGLTWILVIAILMSTVGIYYYFKAIIATYMRDGELSAIKVAPFYRLVLIATTIITLIFGLLPDLLKGLV